MKKRLLTIVAAALLIVMCAFGFAACTDDEADGGDTYDLYSGYMEDGQKVAYYDYETCKLSGGKVVVTYHGKKEETFEDGTYKIEGDKLVWTDVKGKVQEFVKKDNYWYIEDPNAQEFYVAMLVKHGETPIGFTVKERNFN